jgi:hypothetical protein
MARLVAALGLASSVLAGAATLAPETALAQERAQTRPPTHPYAAAELRLLDKTAARVSTRAVPVNEPVSFGTLQILVRTCHESPPEAEPLTAAFLEIEENRPGQSREHLFEGWMYAGSPALSALEHPVYDVWVIDCTGQRISPDDTARQG